MRASFIFLVFFFPLRSSPFKADEKGKIWSFGITCFCSAVYRVVVRHNHLTLARWNAHCAGIETEKGWRLFKELAFEKPVSDEEAEEAQRKWRNEAHAVMWKMRDLEGRLAKKEWGIIYQSAEIPACVANMASIKKN